MGQIQNTRAQLVAGYKDNRKGEGVANPYEGYGDWQVAMKKDCTQGPERDLQWYG